MRHESVRHMGFASPLDHLKAELDWLDRRLAAHVSFLRRTGRFNEDPLRGLYVSDAEAGALLEAAELESADADIFTLQRAALDTRSDGGASLPLARIARVFGLDTVERATLVIAAAPAIERRYGSLFAFAQNDVGRRLPTPDLILSLLCRERASRHAGLARFTADAPLLRHGLITISEAEQGRALADRGLTVDDRIVAVLLGDNRPDPRLASCLIDLPESLPEEPELAARITAAIDGGADCILFEGARDGGQHAAVRRWLAAQDWGLLVADAGRVGDLVGPLAREARLQQAAILLETSVAGVERVAAELTSPDRPLFISAKPGHCDGATLGARTALAVIPISAGPIQRRARWWQEVLPSERSDAAGALAQRNRLGPVGIARVRARLRRDVSLAAAAHVSGHLPALARRVEPRWRWDALLLPDRQRRQLEELAGMLVHWQRVIVDWGFSATAPRPQNVVAMFSGPSGTGKTMAASLVAATADIPLYRVDLSAIFDKYIGETEKHIDDLFDLAESAGAAILFDEADILFGKRTETQDSHDRYANLSTAFLLQRIEEHDGLVILTSNMPGNVDEAFARRLACSITFPLPGLAERRAMWRRAFPGGAPLDPALDLDAVAETFELSGGNIRNAALAAAYLAAADSPVIGQRHVLGAITRELEKLGRVPIAADFGAFGHTV